MDNALPKLYREYGLYSNWRNFPFALDGLKPVERRILFSAYQIAKKFTKSARVDGHVIGNYHPHGSVYGSIVQLVRQGFLDGQGNFGANIGVEPVGASASRYTEIKINNKTLDMAFKYIKYVPWMMNELYQKEPEFLPTMYPFCLLGNEYTQGIGFGFKTYSPCYIVNDLFARLQWLLGIRKRKPTIQPITDCHILSGKDVLEELLTVGKAKVEVKGMMDEDTRRCVATLKSWPPGKKFETILKKLSKLVADTGAVGWDDLSTGDKTQIVFTVLRERNRDPIFKEFVEMLSEAITGAISFEITVITPDNKVEVAPVDKLLLETFNMYEATAKEMLSVKISETNQKIAECELIQKMIPPLKECLETGMEIKESIAKIANDVGETQKAVTEILEKYNIKKLLTINFDTTELQSQLNALQNSFENSREFVMAQYDKF